jgi:hypothetical protein
VVEREETFGDGEALKGRNIMIKPTIGRVVWYRAKLLDNSHPKESPEQAAIVVKVHGDRMVNLVVFGHDGSMVPMTSVPLVQEGDEPPFDFSYCEWMPYQKGQAAKTEALEAAANAARRGELKPLA